MADDIKKQKLTKDDVIHLANLVQLQLSEEEIEMFQDQFGETIDYIKNLEELDTKGVKETSHTGGTKNVSFKDGTTPSRTLSQSDATANANEKKDGYFIVPKILDK
jgi:aspartyl-tRNA(Asn)/glutamyl-tRNA(Gln) amidotransferase subunit C